MSWGFVQAAEDVLDDKSLASREDTIECPSRMKGLMIETTVDCRYVRDKLDE